jgi:acyl-CoA synthetase (AMP-forming)/AMP-acid ligase II
MNTTDFLTIAAAICPDRDVMVFEGKRWTYSQVADRVNRLSNALLELGLQKGDRIGMLQVNCPQYIETYFATAKIGCIFVPLNFRAKGDEISYMLNNAEAKLVLVGDRYADMVSGMMPDLTSTKQYISIEGGKPGMLNYEELISSASPEEVFVDIEDDDITILMYTAGTTGRPKGVPLRHNGFISYIMDNVDPASPEIEERNLLTVPLYHVAGIQAMLAAIYGGRTLVLMRQFEVGEWMTTVQQEHATRAMLVPTMLKNIVDNPDFDKYDLTSLAVITYGAAPMPFEVISKAMSVMPWAKFINAFGQTETASTITMLGPEDHMLEGLSDEEKDKKLKRLASSIGRPLPDVEVKILGENGEALPPNEVGDIVAKGPRIMTGYWQDDQKTAKAFTSDGWLITGDKGWLDDEGYVFLAGRGDDMIIRGGENVSPEEVENAIYSHHKIEEVAVIGVPDPEWGEQIRAVCVLKEGMTCEPDEVMEHCRDKLAGFKRPKSVVFIDTLPRNAMGKILKNKCRELYGKP